MYIKLSCNQYSPHSLKQQCYGKYFPFILNIFKYVQGFHLKYKSIFLLDLHLKHLFT